MLLGVLTFVNLGRPGVNVDMSSSVASPPYFLKQILSPNLKVTVRARMVGQQAIGILLPSAPHSGGII